jgi:hypothetical protein
MWSSRTWSNVFIADLPGICGQALSSGTQCNMVAVGQAFRNPIYSAS